MEFAGFELGEETKEIIIGGKKKLILCPLGVLALFFNGWREHGSLKMHNGLRRYCEYICMHGYRGGATKALAELDSFSRSEAIKWIGRTYSRYIKDEYAMLDYILARF